MFGRLFPLTLTLPPREREQQWTALDNPMTHNSPTDGRRLPLSLGERARVRGKEASRILLRQELIPSHQERGQRTPALDKRRGLHPQADGRRLPLSPRERAGVRGKKPSKMLPHLRLILSLWPRGLEARGRALSRGRAITGIHYGGCLPRFRAAHAPATGEPGGAAQF